MNTSSNKQQLLNGSSVGGGFASGDLNQENETHKRGSIFSLYNVHTNSIVNQKTLTMYNTKTEYSDANRQKSEVTLGADKRRKLLTQEDQDLKTLNMKRTGKSDGSSNQGYESSTLRDQEYDQDDLEEQDRIVIESNELDERGETKSNINLDRQTNNALKSQTSTHLIQNEESIHQLNDQSHSETSMQGGQRRMNNQLLSGLLLEKNIGFNKKTQSKSTHQGNTNMNSSLNRNSSNMPSPLSKTMDYQCIESNPLFGQNQQSLNALDKNGQIDSQIFKGEQQKLADLEDIRDMNEELRNKISNKFFQAANSLVNQEAIESSGIIKKRITQQKSEIQNKNTTTAVSKFKNVVFINKAKKKLLGFLGKERFKNIERFHLGLINDAAVLESTYVNTQLTKEEKKLQQLSQQFDEYKVNPQVFQPDNIFLIFWNAYILLILIFLTIITPIVRSFDTGFDGTSGIDGLQRYLSVITLIVDILISFNKGYYDEGIIITNRKKIIKKYCKIKFYFDVFNVICCAFFEEFSILLIYLVSICRLATCSNIWAEIDEYLEISHKFSTLTQVIELTFLIFLIANLCACGFFYVSKIDHENGVSVTWITQQKIENSDWYTQYIYSIYFEFITMTTIGYGDIFPCSNHERLYVIFMTLVSCAIFGYSLSAIGEIIREVSNRLNSFKQTKYDISKYLKSRNITKRVQLKILKYLEYLNKQEIEGHFYGKGEKIMSRVSQNLREEVQREYYGKIINSISFFSKNFSKNLLNELALNMKELSLAPGDQLFQQGSQDSSLFFLTKGVVELYVSLPCSKNEKMNEKILYRYKVGELIGHQEFLSDQERQFSVRSLSISHFVYIRKHDFLNIIERYPLDYEFFCSLKDDLLFKSQDRFSVCESCKQTGHNILKCRLMFNNFNKMQLIKELNYSESHQTVKELDLNEENNKIYGGLLKQFDLQKDGTTEIFTGIVRRIDKKTRWDITQVKENLKKVRKQFIQDAIRNNRKYNTTNHSGCQDQIYEEINSVDSNDLKISDIMGGESNHAVAHTQLNQATGSFGMSVRQKTGSMQQYDSMTFKSYQRTANNSEYSIHEGDKAFYKKYPKIHFEDGQYLILSSSQHSSSEAEEEVDDDEEYEQQIAYGEQYGYRTDEEYIVNEGGRKPTINETQLRNQTIKRNTAIRPGTGVLPPSPNNRINSITNMDTSIQIHNFQLDSNPTFLANRMNPSIPTSQNSSTMNSIPISNLSALHYQQQQSMSNPSNSPVTGPMGSYQSLPPPPTVPSQQLVNQIPPGQSINQLIIRNNYFDSQDFQEDVQVQQNSNNRDDRKLTLNLPTVEEASELNEVSSFDMTNSYSIQLSQSPLLRKPQREQSKRQQSRKLSQNTLPRNDSMMSSQDVYTLRRKSSRNDSANAKIMRDSLNSKMRKVTYLDSSMIKDQVFSNIGSNSGSNLQNTFSKSHSRSSRYITVNNLERQRSRQSQGTFLNNPNLQLFVYQFDRMKEYKFYYPHNNATMIIKYFQVQKNSKFKSKEIMVKSKRLNQSSSNMLGLFKVGGGMNYNSTQSKLPNAMSGTSYL